MRECGWTWACAHCLSPPGCCLRWAIQEVVKHGGLVRWEEVLLLCGPGSSPLLTHPSSTSSARDEPGTVLQPKPVTLASALGHVCTLPVRSPGSRPPQRSQGKRQERLPGHHCGGWGAGGRAEMQTFKPPSLPLRHLLSLVKPLGQEGGGQAESPTQLSCLGWGPAPSLDPRQAFPVLPTLRLQDRKNVRLCVCGGSGSAWSPQSSSIRGHPKPLGGVEVPRPDHRSLQTALYPNTNLALNLEL